MLNVEGTRENFVYVLQFKHAVGSLFAGGAFSAAITERRMLFTSVTE
jgi:hypothetical protein